MSSANCRHLEQNLRNCSYCSSLIFVYHVATRVNELIKKVSVISQFSVQLIFLCTAATVSNSGK